MRKVTDPILYTLYAILITLKIVGHIDYSWWSIIWVPFITFFAINIISRKLLIIYLTRTF